MAPVTENIKITEENRKFRKVLVEKSRRERINSCMEQLRTLFCQTMQISEENTAFRLEKADILEIAVSVLRFKAFSRANSSYARGFSHCLQETLRHMTLHARPQPRATEAVQRFYVRQRSRLLLRRGHLNHKPKKTSASSSTAALWRPWTNNRAFTE
ncbi:transcription factor HES-5-like [Hoplias malabaricus]|uniref:transcription factor HES-5-like n=1 Tax=Hoplias malabaricus TaxID=27720 RepID=UPI00346227A7